jgi:hypothetical protein
MKHMDGGHKDDVGRHWWQRRRRSGTTGVEATPRHPRCGLVMAPYVCPADSPRPGEGDNDGNGCGGRLGRWRCN